MKKKFAIVTLMGILICSSFYTRVEAADTAKDVAVIASETQEMEDGKITLEFLNQLSSWEELKNTVLPMAETYQNKEDFYCVMLIRSLDKPMVSPIYHDEYIRIGFGGIKLNEIDYNRLMNKYQTIIDIYNASKEIQVGLETRILSESILQVYVSSDNVFYMENTPTKIGQKVFLKPGTTYWESCYNDGSGRQGVVTDNDNSIVRVNGVAYLDENLTVVGSYYKPYNELGETEVDINTSERRMLHICTEKSELGWIFAENAIGLYESNTKTAYR